MLFRPHGPPECFERFQDSQTRSLNDASHRQQHFRFPGLPLHCNILGVPSQQKGAAEAGTPAWRCGARMKTQPSPNSSGPPCLCSAYVLLLCCQEPSENITNRLQYFRRLQTEGVYVPHQDWDYCPLGVLLWFQWGQDFIASDIYHSKTCKVAQTLITRRLILVHTESICEMFNSHYKTVNILCSFGCNYNVPQ